MAHPDTDLPDWFTSPFRQNSQLAHEPPEPETQRWAKVIADGEISSADCVSRRSAPRGDLLPTGIEPGWLRWPSIVPEMAVSAMAVARETRDAARNALRKSPA